MYKLFLIALGGGIGSVLRFLISAGVQNWFHKVFFWGTISVNIIGSFFIGIAWAIFEQNTEHENLRFFVMIGLLGGFTTFSSFSLESFTLFKNGEIKLALSYILISNIGGISAAFFSYYLYNLLFVK
ncbi:MAG: fluoride efflux transporter CrcB [Bacteroidetes bacterium]|nr:MAG: fluoride efflux transporter CrcB [Bacteroidota bacterium]